jgi:hypothetical protein
MDLGHHEDLWNGSENKIHIWESIFWVPEKFGIFRVSYRRSSRRFQRSHRWGPHLPRDPHGPSGCSQAYKGMGNHPQMAHAVGPRGNPKKGAINLGGKFSPSPFVGWPLGLEEGPIHLPFPYISGGCAGGRGTSTIAGHTPCCLSLPPPLMRVGEALPAELSTIDTTVITAGFRSHIILHHTWWIKKEETLVCCTCA